MSIMFQMAPKQMLRVYNHNRSQKCVVFLDILNAGMNN